MLKNRTNCLKSDATNLFFLLIIALCLVLLAAASASCNIGSPDNIQGIVSKNQTVSSRVPKITLPSFSPSQHSKTTAVKNMVDYSIGAGDVLSIKVFDHEELTAKARVTQAGTVDFPLIGEVHVAGLGTTAAAHRIESALANGYIIDPQVTIFIEQFKSKKVVVLGAVYNPGLVELNGSINLLELISQVGGLKDNAGETAIIKRQENGTQKDIPINLDRLIKTGDPQLNIQILGGDTVAIAEGAVCFITGEVNQPGKYLCGSDSTVFNIVTRAGSLTEKALESGIKITRTVNGIKQIMQNVTQDTVVQADDVIFVPQRPVSKEEETQCFISRSEE
uniref:polysaccharide biosynthesis/export family protein n=1 Tax=Candidatus Electrothrix sp. TaxID=2170559 RepID=UPI004057B7C0